jgi:hypothetical protein
MFKRLSKLTALFVFASIVFNCLSFLFFETHRNGSSYFGTQAVFGAALNAANPLNAVNDLMKKMQGGAKKPCKQKNDGANPADRALTDERGVLTRSFNFQTHFVSNGSVLFAPVRFDFSNLKVSQTEQNRDYTGVLRLFAFLLIYFAVLKEGWSVKIRLINKNAVA